jgi:hypothetical protein
MKSSNRTLGTIAALSTALTLPLTAFAQTPSDTQRLEQLERQVRDLQQKSATPPQERVRFNGFLSVGYGWADNDAGYGGFYEDYDIEHESRLGLQGTFTISPSTEVIMQLVARGNEEWDPAMEWAYIAHKFSNNFKARAGKMRLPLFMYSDSLEVGYAQPWARPPIEIYGAIPFASYTGADAIYDWNLPNSTLSAQAFGGQSTNTISIGDTSASIEVRDILGVSLNWTDFVWTLRGIYSDSNFTLPGVPKTDTAFYGAGVGYNDGSWQVLGEITNTEVDGASADTQSAYVTVAKRLGVLTPYITYAITETQDDDERPLTAEDAFILLTTPGSPFFNNPSILQASDLYNVEREAISLGVRWDVVTNVALKFDVTRADSFGDTGGGLDGNLASPTVRYEDATIYTIKLDAVF